MPKTTASDICKLLELKYPVEKFLTVPECKIGSTWFKSMCSRFDMWIMARSWQHPRFIGCEVKVSRQDFLNDNKWSNYLPYCTEFYFVASHGIIGINEVPEQAGLIETTKNCKRLIIKKKAPVRDIEIPQSLFVYILMCRTRVMADVGDNVKTNIWSDWLQEMESNKKLGYNVAYHIRRLVDKQVGETIIENKKLRDENGRLQKVKECIASLGLKESELKFGGTKRKIEEALSGIPFDLPLCLEQIERDVRKALKVLKLSAHCYYLIKSFANAAAPVIPASSPSVAKHISAVSGLRFHIISL